MTAQGAISLAIEQVMDTPQLLVETQDSLDKLIQDNGRAEMVSKKLFRVTFQTSLPGEVMFGDLDDVTTGFPTGGQSEFSQAQLAPITAIFPIAWSKLAEIAVKPKLAIENVVPKQMADVVKRVKQFRDMNLNAGDGTGTIGYITGVSGQTITLDNSNFGAKNAVKGQTVAVFNGTALRGTFKVGSLNNQLGSGQTITADGTTALPNGVANGDILRVGGTADGAPLGPNGVPYFLNNVASGLRMGVDASVAANNWILSNGFDLAGSQVTLPALRIPLAQIKQVQGPDAVAIGKLVINTSPAQIAAYEELGDALATIPLAGGLAGGLDLMWRGKKTVDGHPINESNHASNSRWDFLSVKSWGKVKYGNAPFWFDWEGKKVFAKYGSNGNITAGAQSYMIDMVNYYVDNTKNQASLYNAKVVAGF
jgi:hypothetical protein